MSWSRVASWVAPALLSLLGTLSGCGGAAATREPAGATGSVADEFEATSEPADQAAPATAAPDSEPSRRRLGRAELDAVLDAGPGAFLTRIEVRPHFSGRAFDGWELVRFTQPDSDLAASGIEPGDVVTTVNRHRLERPESLQKLWKALRSAEAIVVRGRRDGEPFELRFEVSGAPGGPRPQPEV